MTEWISVKDGLPEDDQLVMLYVYNPYGPNDFFVGYRHRTKNPDGSFMPYTWIAQHPCTSTGTVICEKGNTYLSPRKVTHWMPLPEPPKEET